MFTRCTAQPAAVEVEHTNAVVSCVEYLGRISCTAPAFSEDAADFETSVAVSEWSLYGDSHTLATLPVFREKPGTMATFKAWFRSLLQPCQAEQSDLEEPALPEATPPSKTAVFLKGDLESSFKSPPKSALKSCLKKREDADMVDAGSSPKSALESCLKRREAADTVDAGSPHNSALKSCLKKREDADAVGTGLVGVSWSAPEEKADADIDKMEVASKWAVVKKNIKGINFVNEEASTSSGETSDGLRSSREE